MSKRKMSTLDAYIQICFGSKLVIGTKTYAYRDINKGKACSITDFEKFLLRKLKLPIKDIEQYTQLNLFDMLECQLA